MSTSEGQRTLTLTPMNTLRKPYLYEHLRKTEQDNRGIHEITTGVSLLMGTSSTIESIAPVNPRINLEKYEHLCQVEDLNPDGQVPPLGTQPTDLSSVHLPN
jgi:hypothetical protein